MIRPTPAPVPTGFRQGAAGLVLPVEASRRRRTLTWPEWRAIEKASTLLADQRLHADFVIRCVDPQCPDRKIQRMRGGAGMILRCGCTDRVFERHL